MAIDWARILRNAYVDVSDPNSKAYVAGGIRIDADNDGYDPTTSIQYPLLQTVVKDAASRKRVTANEVYRYHSGNVRKLLAGVLGFPLSNDRWRLIRVAAAYYVWFTHGGKQSTKLSRLVSECVGELTNCGLSPDLLITQSWHQLFCDRVIMVRGVLQPFPRSGKKAIAISHCDVDALVLATLALRNLLGVGKRKLRDVGVKLLGTTAQTISKDRQYHYEIAISLVEIEGQTIDIESLSKSMSYDQLMALLDEIYDGELPSRSWFSARFNKLQSRTFTHTDLLRILNDIESSPSLSQRLRAKRFVNLPSRTEQPGDSYMGTLATLQTTDRLRLKAEQQQADADKVAQVKQQLDAAADKAKRDRELRDIARQKGIEDRIDKFLQWEQTEAMREAATASEHATNATIIRHY